MNQPTDLKPVSKFRILGLDLFDIVTIVLSILIVQLLLRSPLSTRITGDGDFLFEGKMIAEWIKGQRSFQDLFIAHAPLPTIYATLTFLPLSTNATDIQLCTSSVFFNSILLAITLLALRRIGRLMFSDAAGKIAVLFLILFPYQFYQATKLGAEPLAVMFIALAIYQWVKWQYLTVKNGEKPRLFGSARFWWFALFMASSILCRPNLILMLPIGGALLLLGIIRKREFALKVGWAGIAAMVIAGIFGLAVLQGAKRLPGKIPFRDQTEQLSLNFFIGRFQMRNEPWDWRFMANEVRDSSSRDYNEWVAQKIAFEDERIADSTISQADQYFGFFIEDVKRNPHIFLYQIPVKALASHVFIANKYNAQSFRLGFLKGPAGYFLFHLAANLFMVIGLVFSIRFMLKNRKNLLSYWMLWLPWLALLAFHSWLYVEPRYLVPAHICIFLMAAAQLQHTRWAKRWL